MAKKSKESKASRRVADPNVMGLRGDVVEQPITDTLELNYMPYAMSVIVSRAIPEIDGFKPSHRKLLYCMHRMGLQNGARTKSANIVGQTMHYNPHGDATIYETMVRLTRDNEALNVPFVDSKGNFGKVYSRDMAYAASRYTEAKLAPICAELFRDIDKDTVDFVPNYDNSTTEPTLLPTTFPNVLVSANTGIAVGMASQICGFNLEEVCRTTIQMLKDPDHDVMTTLPAPDFPTGGEILYDPMQMMKIYQTGRGSFPVRSKWRYDEAEHIIEVFEIPYTTTAEAIIDKCRDLIKEGKIKEISDMRDETDLGGLKLAIDVKRGTDPERLMAKLFRMTPLQDNFPCNFNILVAGTPRVMGVGEILTEWIAWRTECVRRRTHFDMTKKKERLHLLEGLKAILLDIDRAISIIRNTEVEADVVPNLMIGFGIDEVQAEYVAEIRLRNINREYILRRVAETDELARVIAELMEILNSQRRLRGIIADELKQVVKKHPSPRRTTLVFADELEDMADAEPEVEDYPVHLFVSRQGYFKKITPQSLRMSGEQKYKEDDGLARYYETTNRAELLVFTDRQQAYKLRVADIKETKASALGDYLPTRLGMDEGETVVATALAGDYTGTILLFFENGKCARVTLASFATKTNRKRLTGAYSDKSPLVTLLPLDEEQEIAVYTAEGRCLVFSSAQLAPKTSRATQGVQVMTVKRHPVTEARFLKDTPIQNTARYQVRAIPGTGAKLTERDRGEEQMSLLD